jgi:hypothetical protein
MSGSSGIEFCMKKNDPRSRIQDLCSEAVAASSPGEIEPILTKLRAALHEKIQDEEKWMSLCERAAVEQDPKKLLHLVSEINRRFRSEDDISSASEKPTKLETGERSDRQRSDGPSSAD